MKYLIFLMMMFVVFVDTAYSEWESTKISNNEVIGFVNSDDYSVCFGGAGTLKKMNNLGNSEWINIDYPKTTNDFIYNFSQKNDKYLINIMNPSLSTSKVFLSSDKGDSWELMISQHLSILSCKMLDIDNFYYSEFNKSTQNSVLVKYNIENNKKDTLLSPERLSKFPWKIVFNDMENVGKDTIIISTFTGDVIGTFNGGSNWFLYRLANGTTKLKLINGTLWGLVEKTNEAYSSTDYGLSWTKHTFPTTSLSMPDIAADYSSNLYIVSSINKNSNKVNVLYKSTDNGSSWDEIYINEQPSIDFLSLNVFNDVVYIGTNTGYIFSNPSIVSVEIDDNQLSYFETINVYPNPASSDYINIDFGNKMIESIEVIDINGNRIFQDIINESSSYKINISGFRTGSYFIRVKSENKISVSKFVKE